jgi:uncharacterized protein DUF6602
MRQDFEGIRRDQPHPEEKGEEVEEKLREFLNKHLPKRFSTTKGHVIDNENKMSSQADVLVYDAENSPVYRAAKNTLILPSDSIAAVIEVKSSLDKRELGKACEKIAEIKALKKSAVTNIDQPVTHSPLIVESTLGIIFAFDSETSLESLAQNLKEFNSSRPSHLWADMVVVLGHGIILYWFQYPGEEGFAGQSMPPASENFVVPPFYTHLTISKEGDYALNRFFGTLISHLTFYRKRSSISLENLMRGSQREFQSIQGYWFNSLGKLIEVPENQLGEGPAPLWQIDVLKSGETLGRYYQFEWADGFIYQVIPPSPDAMKVLDLLIKLSTDKVVHGIPSRDGFKMYTSVIAGVPPTKEEIKKHIMEKTQGFEVKWYD